MSDAELLNGYVWFLVIGGCIATAFLTGDAANEKGRTGFRWGLLALIFGPIFLIGIAAQGDRRQRRYLRFLADKQGFSEKTPDQ